MGVVNFIFCGIFITMYTAGWFFPKFRRYIKKNIWLDNLPGVLELIFLLNFSEYLFVDCSIMPRRAVSIVAVMLVSASVAARELSAAF